MIPHERSLVEKLKDAPFALIGVNSDRDKQVYFEEAKTMGVTWRSFWCGEKGGAGAIPSQWQVGTWPTLYVLDGSGVIRHRWLGRPGPEKLDAAIEALIAEMDQGK
ncbi:MAG: TlpA family protein disulfide reductase [Planctomycetota bacterium]